MGDGRGEIARYAVVLVVLVAAAFGSIHVLRATLRTQYPLMVVVSQSMVPTLDVGDFILVEHVDEFNGLVAAPRPEGEILVFLRPGASDEYIVHRAVDKFTDDGGWWFTTKGDNNPVSDGRPVSESSVLGTVIGRIPLLGYFPLFIKTSGGFLLVASLMVIVFFSDYLMPLKGEEMDDAGGRFPWPSLVPFLAAPIAYAAYWFLPRLHLEVDLLVLACWYIGCLAAPLAFGDDDLCLMFWLYDFVLLMVPLGCDLIWWLTGITPSMWWYVQGSTVPITWLLMKETPMFHRAFTAFIWLLLPGCALFLLTMMAKRRGVRSLVEVSRWMRSNRTSAGVDPPSS